MTLAAVWMGDQRLYAVADTRIVRSPGNVLTEHGPKILAINLVCKQPSQSGFFDRVTYRNTLGFAYAGSSLAALCTHSLVNTLFQTLIAGPGTRAPLLRELAATIAKVSEHYMREIGQLSAAAGLFQSIVFGYCVVSDRFEAFTIRPHISEGSMSVEIAEESLSPDAVVIIGTDPERLRERTAEIRAAAAHPVVFADAPRRALRSIIDAGNQDSTVGGAVQYAWVTRGGLELVADAVPRRPPLPGLNVASLVLGFDMHDFGSVGPYIVGINSRV